MLKTIGNVLNVKDVISDAHNTFIKEYQRDKEVDTQMEDMMKEKAFNWSDEEIMQLETRGNPDNAKLIKPKYKKSPHKNKQNSNSKT